MIRDLEGIVSHWAEHFSDLLNCVNPVDPTLYLFQNSRLLLSLIALLHSMRLCQPPRKMKNNITAGPDGISRRYTNMTESKISHDWIFEFQYADDAAIPVSTISALRDSLNVLSCAYTRAELVVNTAKTVVLSLVTNQNKPATPFVVYGDALNDSQEFMYLGTVWEPTTSLEGAFIAALSPQQALSGQGVPRISEKYAIAEGCCRRIQNGPSMVLRLGTPNAGSLTGRSMEIAEMLERKRIDICCLQETRWKSNGVCHVNSDK
ncbi:hypothetical protein HELRODRAFT_175885 [Helobdella robusta]|uniref:Reverse transcriptase domain-containing protein n=1 Tax=Helobdella robusta TaxID=6412 RepID=T1F9U1_HELRO|nr:hypothetical protein HELRODRAFT_175885 [Helobdella robusta]ESO00452.1 hypothetical protein HELRODRAFT_175885 [Helobdella robusta]